MPSTYENMSVGSQARGTTGYTWQRYEIGATVIEVRLPTKARVFALIQDVQIGYEACLASYPMGIAAISPKIKRLERDADYSPPI
jgi:hypothetical protein